MQPHFPAPAPADLHALARAIRALGGDSDSAATLDRLPRRLVVIAPSGRALFDAVLRDAVATAEAGAAALAPLGAGDGRAAAADELRRLVRRAVRRLDRLCG